MARKHFPIVIISFRIIFSVVVFGIFILLSPEAYATENGLTEWPVGLQTIVPAILPKPGATEFDSYMQYYSTNRFNDSHGHSEISGFQINVFAMAQRIVHTWDKTLWGLNLSSGVILSENHQFVRAGGLSNQTTGIEFVYLTPLYLTYNTPTLSLLFGPSVYIPTGSYNANSLANASVGYDSYGQELAATWFPNRRWELSEETTITVNGTNDKTHYHSGSLLITDFGTNVMPFESKPRWWVGLGGSWADQFTNDTINGTRVGDGNRLDRFLAGPQLIYYLTPTTAIAFKWQHDFIAHNAASGDRFWFEFTIPLGA